MPARDGLESPILVLGVETHSTQGKMVLARNLKSCHDALGIFCRNYDLDRSKALLCPPNSDSGEIPFHTKQLVSSG